MINYAQELNSEQLRVVQEGDGPCLVLAGAGSGKTRTITYRVAYLLEKGIKAENILLVTFTNKAAAEMKERVARLAAGKFEIRNSKFEIPPPQGGGLPWSGTFHHIAYRILRIYAPLLGYKNNFTVLDSDDSEGLIRICVKEIKSDRTGQRFPSSRVVGGIISYARNAETPLEKVIDDRFYHHSQFTEEIKKIAALYSQKKKEAQAMDFDDLLTNFLALLQTSPTALSSRPAEWSKEARDIAATSPSQRRGQGEVSLSKVCQKYATQFQYILVDEYQDTNKIQASIIKQLASVHNNVLVVGDDAQSIYSFRAADIQNILQFEKEYFGAKIFKLEINYRSTNKILDLANNVIANNVAQFKKNLRVASDISPSFQEGVGGVAGVSALGSPNGRQTPPNLPLERGGGQAPQPSLHPHMDQETEAAFVAKKIEEHLKEGLDPKEIAVLFRAAHHSQMLEAELVQRGIAYDYRGGVRFFERAHIKDVLAYLRIMNNISDTSAWLRILMHEEGIGPAAAGRVAETMKAVAEIADIAKTGESLLGGKAQGGWQNFVRIWNHILGVPERKPAPLIESLVVSPYREYLEAEFIDSRERVNDIKQLAKFAERYQNLDEFLAEMTLQETFRDISSEPGEPKPKIVLSTIHQAKGLEWGAVFIVNLSSGAFPNDRATREDGGLEEERRLFYVAITRAKQFLYLTYPMSGGSFGDFVPGPSPFLGEINPELIDDHSLLMNSGLVLDDPNSDITYVPEDAPKEIRPVVS